MTVRLDLQRSAGKILCTVKGNGAAVLVDRFRTFAEMDERLANRLGLVWDSFREEARAYCER